jgi:ATP adenylyltransferase
MIQVKEALGKIRGLQIMDNCEFCLEFSSSQSIKDTFFHRLFPHLHDRILFETNNFVVVPGLGQIVEGYLLIITKNHCSSMGDLPQRVYSELDWIIKSSSEIIKSYYSSDCIAFEHGTSNPLQGGGCCIEHAHLHIAPLNVDIVPYIVQTETYNAQNYPESARALLLRGKPYLYVSFSHKNGSESLLLDATDLPSQYMRRVIAKALGKADEWDWNIFLGEKEVESCLKKLKRPFLQLKREYVDEKAPRHRDLLNITEQLSGVCKY